MQSFTTKNRVFQINSHNGKRSLPKQLKLVQDKKTNDFLGTKRLFDSSNTHLYRCMWLCIIVSCTAACIYQIVLRVQVFVDNAITLEVKMEPQMTFKFPSITLCNYPMEYLLDYTQTLYEEERSLLTDPIDTFELWKNFSINPKDLYIKKGILDSKWRSVDQSMAVDYLYTADGICVILTMKKLMEYQGPFTFIDIIWNITVKENGYLFFLHNDTHHHVYDGLLIAELPLTSYESQYRITAEEFQNLNTRQNPCVPEEAAIQCYNDCVEEQILTKMSCGLPFVNSTLRQCNTFQSICDTYKALYADYWDLSEQLNKCGKCKRRCSETKYTLHKDIERKNENNVTSLRLFYADDMRTLISERETVTPSGLFSEIGGTIGLYLGISLLAIINLVDSYVKISVLLRNKIN